MYSKITQKTYIQAISQFLEYFSKTDPSKINNEDIFRYIEHKTKKPLR